MRKTRRAAQRFYRRKNRRKTVRTVVQAGILLVVGLAVAQAAFGTSRYKEPDRTQWTGRQGFVALSYFGVARSGTPKLVAKRQLEAQLGALSKQGYVTVSQQDILDYYAKGKPLPDKALFLSFEDGRNDSELFAQPILEKYNDKATFLSYANKMGSGDRKFLQPGDMLQMTKTGYWELGTNGYRLSYINIFDKDGRFIGMRDENKLPDKGDVEYYNHYLMDFIRDENMIPVEDRQEMEKRIAADYDSMEKIYTDTLGFVPQVYMIMHANALGEGMNRLVADANESNIERLFKLHFNREGDAFNGPDGNLFDLTRVQPQPYWQTNHLLMRIRHDSGQDMAFVTGDKARSDKWTSISGAAEFDGDRIALTSPAGGEGLLVLKDSAGYGDIRLTAKLDGNVVGKQSVYMQYDRQRDAYVRVTLADNGIVIERKKPGGSVETLLSTELDDVRWNSEDLALNKATVYTQAQTQSGAQSDEPSLPVNVAGSRQLDIAVRGGKLTVAVDGRAMADGLATGLDGTGGVALGAAASPLNGKDDIYDGLFDDVRITSLDDTGGNGDVLYDNGYSGVSAVINALTESGDRAIDWAIDTF